MKGNLRVGFLAFYHPHLGGSGISATRIAENLARDGHEPHFIGYDTDMNPLNLARAGIKLHRVGKVDYPCLKSEPYVWTLANKICEVHDKVGLDLVHAHYAVPHSLAAFVAKQQLKIEGKDLPYIVAGRGSDIHTNGYKNDLNRILRLSLNEADAITYVSKDLMDIAEQSLGITNPGNHITNFVDTNIFHPVRTSLKNDLGIKEDAFIIGHASNYAPIKQTDHFYRLAKELRSRGTIDSIHFLMVGKGNEREQLRRKIAKDELDSYFTFTGRLDMDQIIEAHTVFDVLLLPSKKEGCSLTILESMACETPVIGTNVGGINEVINSGNGYLFEPGDIESLANIVEDISNDNKGREVLGKNGRKYVEENHSVDVVMDKYMRLYRKVIDK